MKKIALSLLLLILVTSCVPKDYKKKEVFVPAPEIYNIDSNVTSIDFLPESYKMFFYLKDSKNAFEIFENGDLYNSIKDNYLYRDLKYSYLENVDLFFTKFNFEFNSIFKYINSDTMFGLTDNSFFLVASMTFESKLLISLLNIAPDSIINDFYFAGHKIYSVNKNSSSIYYTIVNGYIVFTDSQSGAKEIINSVMSPKHNNGKFIEGVENNQVVYVTKVNPNNNLFDMFPEVTEVEVNYNVTNHDISFRTSPTKNFKEYVDSNDSLYHETLKYISPTTPMLYYNSSYNVKKIFTSLLQNDDKTKYNLTINRLQEILGGVYFIVDNIEPLLYKNDPGLGLVLNIKPDGKNYDKIVELTGQILGVKWNIESSNSNISKYTAEDSSFTLVTTNENLCLFTNNFLADNFIDRVTRPQYSMYDQYKKLFSSENQYLDSYLCYNPETIKDTSIELIKRYLFSKINMTEDEYQKSFGDIIELVSGFNYGYIDYSFDKQSNKFYGSIKKSN